MTRVLVLGAGGQVGRAVLAHAHVFAGEVIGLTRAQCDITNTESVANAFNDYTPDIVVNTAAMTAVDQAQREPETAFAINRDGAANVALACAKRGAALMHLSTDYVFGGGPGRPLVETDPIGPLNVYGQSKAEGESTIRTHLEHHVILRTAWVYGPNSANFFMTMMRLGQTQASPKIVSDEHSCPTFADDLAQAILSVCEKISSGQGQWGTFHTCGHEGMSRFEFANSIMKARRVAGLKFAQLLPTTQAEYGAPALRPIDSRMDGGKFQRAYGCELRGLSEVLPSLVAKIADEAGDQVAS